MIIALVLFGLALVAAFLRIMFLQEEIDTLRHIVSQGSEWARRHDSIHEFRDTYQNWPTYRK